MKIDRKKKVGFRENRDNAEQNNLKNSNKTFD